MAVALPDPSILVVDAELGFLVSAHLPTIVDCLLLRIEMPRGAFSATTLDVPTAIRVRHHMMGIWSTPTYHMLIPLRVYHTKNIATLNFNMGRHMRVVKDDLYRYSEQT